MQNGLDFRSSLSVALAAIELRKLLIDSGTPDEIEIRRKINSLNRFFPNGKVKIEEEIYDGEFEGSNGLGGRRYKYIVFKFAKEGKAFNVLFLKDPADLSAAELKELEINDKEKHRLDCPGLEGVWFVNPKAKDTLKASITRLGTMPFKLNRIIDSGRPWGGSWAAENIGLRNPRNGKVGRVLQIMHNATVDILIDGSKRRIAFEHVLEVAGNEILGETLYSMYGGSLMPLEVYYLDAEGPLSVQVHPDAAYAYQKYGKPIGEDQSYYCVTDGKMALGFKNGITKKVFYEAIKNGSDFRPEDYLNIFATKAGQLYVIPAGTVHTLMKGVVVETTLGLDKTYRIWDFNGYDGRPARDMHIDDAFNVLNFGTEKGGDAVKRLTSERTILKQNTTGCEFLRRCDDVGFSINELELNPGAEWECDTIGTFNALTLVSGNGVVVYPKNRSADLLDLSLWESCIVPAVTGKYAVKNTGNIPIRILRSYIPVEKITSSRHEAAFSTVARSSASGTAGPAVEALRRMNRIIESARNEKPVEEAANVMITTRCPYSCEICLAEQLLKNQGRSRDIDKNTLYTIFDELKGFGRVNLVGPGETTAYGKGNVNSPGVSEDFLDIVRYAASRAGEVRIVTNGYYVPTDQDEAKKFFAQFPSNVVWVFSVDKWHEDQSSKRHKSLPQTIFMVEGLADRGLVRTAYYIASQSEEDFREVINRYQLSSKLHTDPDNILMLPVCQQGGAATNDIESKPLSPEFVNSYAYVPEKTFLYIDLQGNVVTSHLIAFMLRQERMEFSPDNMLGNLHDKPLKDILVDNLFIRNYKIGKNVLESRLLVEDNILTVSDNPTLFIDPITKKMRGLAVKEREALDNVLAHLIDFAGPESVESGNRGVRRLIANEVNRLIGDRLYGSMVARGPPIDVYIIDDVALKNELPAEYKYLARYLITHARTQKDTAALRKQADSLFITHSAYESLLSLPDDKLKLWIDREVGNVTDSETPSKSSLTAEDIMLAEYIFQVKEDRTMSDLRGQVTVKMTRDYARRHKKELFELWQIIGDFPDMSEDDLVADSWGRGKFSQDIERDFQGKWDYSYAVSDGKGEIIGAIICYERPGKESKYVPDSLYIHYLITKPYMQGNGLGTGLLVQAAKELLSRGGYQYIGGSKPALSLQVDKKHTDSARFFRALGFEKAGEVKYINMSTEEEIYVADPKTVLVKAEHKISNSEPNLNLSVKGRASASGKMERFDAEISKLVDGLQWPERGFERLVRSAYRNRGNLTEDEKSELGVVKPLLDALGRTFELRVKGHGTVGYDNVMTNLFSETGSALTEKQGLVNLLNIILAGKIVNSCIGDPSFLDLKDGSGPYGPPYILFYPEFRTEMEGVVETLSGDIRPRYNIDKRWFEFYLVPTQGAKEAVLRAINMAVIEKLMAQDDASEAITKVVTPEEYLAATEKKVQRASASGIIRSGDAAIFRNAAELMMERMPKKSSFVNRNGQLLQLSTDKLITIADLHTEMPPFDGLIQEIGEENLITGSTKVVLSGDLVSNLTREDYESFVSIFGQYMGKKYDEYKQSAGIRAYKLLLKIAELKIKYPLGFYVVPGNGELGLSYKKASENFKSLFTDENGKISAEKIDTFDAIKKLIDSMPLFAAVTVAGEDRYLISHGGVIENNKKLSEKELIDYPRFGADKVEIGDGKTRGIDADNVASIYYADACKDMNSEGISAKLTDTESDIQIKNQIFGHMHLFGSNQKELGGLGIVTMDMDGQKIPYAIAYGSLHILNSFSLGGKFTYLESTKGKIIPRQVDVSNKDVRDSVSGDRKVESDEVARNGLASRAGIDESKRMHDENKKYTPNMPKKTILCHIIADSIVSAGQKKMLSELEINMRDESYFEKVVPLSVKSPDKFVEELSVVMEKQRKLYEGYTVNFDVACPNTDIVNKIMESNVGVKALAFEPSIDADVVQVEGIILALRALNSGQIESLREAYKVLAGKDLSRELSSIADVNEFIRKITFILPVAKIKDYNEIKKLNRLIEENIRAAA
ncbi:MAG: GNAT family N-acetyltransferase [Candidatus Omnitrophota bacterium]|nr:GNAT family N-acetyltransferase [Candidatus Omnitrophota bacterium]